MKISFVIPTYNEEQSIVPLLAALNLLIAKQHLDAEILFVDDGSTDATLSVIENQKVLHNTIHVAAHRKNFGKAAALSTGFARAEGDIIITLDADLQDDPEEIPKLLEKIDAGFDVVTGWKKDRHDPWHKVIPSRVINFLVRKIFHIELHDMNCGLKVYKKEVLKELPLYGDLYRYMLIFAHVAGFRVTEIPTTHHARKFGKSKYGVGRIFRGFFDLFTVYFLTRYSPRPLHFFGIIGFGFSSIGTCVLIYLLVLKIFGESIGDRPLLLFAILLVLVGAQIISVGFIAELIAHSKKPPLPPLKRFD